MKQSKLKNASLLLVLSIAMYSCQEEGSLTIENGEDLTQEIEKIETTYVEGDVKIENFFKSEKIETEASLELKEMLDKELMLSYVKQKTHSKSNSNGYVAVFKDITCAGNDELIVHMDCEDGSGSDTDTVDYKGDAYIDVNDNMVFKFCIVPNDFKQTNHDYAVLNLDSTVPSGAIRIDRKYDNEDHNNKNKSTTNGTVTTGWKGYTLLSGRNLVFSFLWYQESATVQNISSLDMTYAVLGKFGVDNEFNRGALITDDEDSRNANRCYIYTNGVANSVNTESERQSISNILSVGRNTSHFLTKVDY